MQANTAKLVKTAIMLSVPVILMVSAVGWKIGHNANSKIMSVQCVDTASQETVFYQDYILDADKDYDSWTYNLGSSKVVYMQPTGVVCTLRDSVMAVENATGTVD